MATKVTRTNPRTGQIERPWRNRDGQFVLADPVHGAQRHHDKFAVKVDTVEEVAALVAKGFSVRMTDGESPPSLISPDSLSLEDVEDGDPASLYAEMPAKPPFEKEAMMEELKRALLVQANQIAHAGGLEYALAFMGFPSDDASYPYASDDAGKVDLRRFFATEYLDRSFDYAFQVGRHHLFDDAVAQDVSEFIKGANPTSSDGRGSPLANPASLCRIAADTAFGRWKLANGSDLSVRELALLAQMKEPAVRNSLSKERIAIGKDGVDNAIAQAWLGDRRDFRRTRSEEAWHKNQAGWFRSVLDREEFGTAFRKIMEDREIDVKALAAKATVRVAFVEALAAGQPGTDVEKLERVGIALELDVPHFAAIAVEAALRIPTRHR